MAGRCFIYIIILLEYFCLSVLANSRSQFLLDHLGRCLKLFVSNESISCHEFASQFGLANTQNYREYRVARANIIFLNKPVNGHCSPGRVDRSPATTYMSGDNSDHSGVRLRQNGEMQQVKTATKRDYTFTA